MIHNADPADRRDGPVEQEFAVIEVNVSAEVAFQEFHQRKSGRHDHLKNIVGGVTDQFARRGLKIEHSSEE